IRAVRSAREAEPTLGPDEVLALVSDVAGVAGPLVQAAIAYWAAFSDEIDALIARAVAAESQGRQRWEREHGLLAQ
ncbi:MAG: hypothetical protein ACR2JG_10910, partial [Geodermatophilaceae bacterium]